MNLDLPTKSIRGSTPEKALDSATSLSELSEIRKRWPKEVSESDVLFAAFQLGLSAGFESNS